MHLSSPALPIQLPELTHSLAELLFIHSGAAFITFITSDRWLLSQHLFQSSSLEQKNLLDRSAVEHFKEGKQNNTLLSSWSFYTYFFRLFCDYMYLNVNI